MCILNGDYIPFHSGMMIDDDTTFMYLDGSSGNLMSTLCAYSQVV